jgi:hypothetical protein
VVAAPGCRSDLHLNLPEIKESRLNVGAVELGQIIALVGMVVLLLTGMRRQRARKSGQSSTPKFFREQRWLHGAAYGLILVGLLLMWAKK